jgi:DNA (cytosine-5)-methyltransferase 1
MATAVSLFSGCGGFCAGVELAGFEIKASVERDKYAAMTYRRNFPHVPLFEGDIAEFLTNDPVSPALASEEIDLVFGGPPCQGFSQIGTRDPKDERNDLYLEYLRVVRALRPIVCLMENVPNLLLLRKGFYRERILRDFAKSGYKNCAVLLITASDHGVPQKRQRAMFVGVRDGYSLPLDLRSLCESLLESQRRKAIVTVWEAIGDLPEEVVDSGETMPYMRKAPTNPFQREMRLRTDGAVLSAAYKADQGIKGLQVRLHNHHTKEMQDRRRRLITHLKPGLKADSLPKSFWDGLRPEKWRRLHPDWPSHTILAQMHRDLSEFVHPTLDRWITVREAARLQSFHDGFIFEGSEWQQLKQIGNAVPPLMGLTAANVAVGVLTEIGALKRARSFRPGLAVQTTLPLAAGL